MDDQQALDIVSALAGGANPITGEIFAADSPYQHPDVIRGLYCARHALESRVQAKQPPKQPHLPQAGAMPMDTTPSYMSRPDREEVGSGAPRKPQSANAGKPWSGDEDRQLLAAFDADRPLADIARDHARSVGGVRARLEKHGRLEPSPATRWPRKSDEPGAVKRPVQ